MVKKRFDEKSKDESPSTEKDRFEITVYNVIMDTVVSSMEKRFSKNLDLRRDLAVLDPKYFTEISSSQKLPENCMVFLYKKIDKFNPLATPGTIKEELISFASNWDKLKLSLEEAYEINYEINDYDEEAENDMTPAEVKKTCKSCTNCPVCCYLILHKCNMFQGTYSVLSTVYHYLLTLPISQVSCERSFSILKYIKSRLRNRLSNERVESFIMMNVEKAILNKINNEDIITALANTSTTLKKALMY